MKVITAKEMAALEKKAFQKGFSPDLFMQNAARGIALALIDYTEHLKLRKLVTLVVGKGNNAGDAFCAGLILKSRGYQVIVHTLFPIESCSALCQKYWMEFEQKGGEIRSVDQPSDFSAPHEGILIDGIFGTGFKGEAPSKIAKVIETINSSKVPSFAIDIPSGLDGDTGEVKGSAVSANFTIFLGLPKKGFFINGGWNYVGHLVHVDFGLPEEFISSVKPSFEMLTKKRAAFLIPKVVRTRHKYEAGFVIGFSGSKGMMGASILSGMGVLRGGAGMVKLVHMQSEFEGSSAYPELIHKTFQYHELEKITDFLKKATAVFLGPGMGLCSKMAGFFPKLIDAISAPCVLDADALTLLAEQNLHPPKGSILTPHEKEAQLIFKSLKSKKDLFQLAQNYVDKNDVTIVLKGAPTFIFSKQREAIVSVSGDPGMATAGSGDVLTGLIAALLSQKLSPINAASLGVFLHGKAGEFAASKKTSFAMCSTDLLKAMHKAWIFLMHQKK